MNVLLVAVNAKYTHMNPALYSIRAYADPEEKMTEIVEYTINQYPRDVLADIFRRKPQVIGFSVYIWNRAFIEQILGDVKKILPETIVLLGGPEAENDRERLLREFPSIDGIFVGEGEPQWKQVLNLLDRCENSGMQMSEIREKVRSVLNEISREISMDDLTFFYNDKNIDRFDHRMLYYETSRGCPFRCSYCLSSQDKGLRFRSLEKVFSELQFFLDHRVPIVKFIDRTFNVSHEHAMGIWQYLSEHDNGFTRFHFEIEAELLTEEELSFLSTVRKGLFQFELGLQSIHAKTLEAVHRSIHVEKIFHAVQVLHDTGRIHVHLDLIAGLPYEGLREFIESFNVAYECGADVLQLGFLKVLPGTYMAECADRYGILYEKNAPYEVFSTKWISYDELRELKGVEEMLERYGNSGAFAYSMRAFRRLFETPYEMYAYLSNHYEKHTEQFVKQSRISAYEMLRNAFRERAEAVNADGAYTSMAEALSKTAMLFSAFDGTLLLDLYSREKLKARPGFIPGKALRTDASSVTKHREALSVWLPAFVESGTLVEKECVLEFVYEGSGAACEISVSFEESGKVFF